MASRSRLMLKTCVAAAVLSLVASDAAFAQAMSGKKGNHAASSGEAKPKVDEKAYKAALDKIPTPKKPYDPWAQVHDPEPAAKPSGKSN
jgi:hypothetical protein